MEDFAATLAGVDAEPQPAQEAREERLAQNEVLFRSVNEAIEQQALRFGGMNDEYEFICECSMADCLERVSLTLGRYEHVRASGMRFVVVPGHAQAAVELVVESPPGYDLVEKDGAAGVVAEHEDPRDATSASDFDKET